jgi:Protein of unknown function (DUF3048) N-terminal domain/Protein of unknown function (DUF3048) C-terminal domain
MVARPSNRTLLIAGAVTVVVLAGGGTAIGLAASSGSGKKSTATSVAPSTSAVVTTPAATPTPTPTKPAVAALNPLTGKGAVPTGPVFAVKIDDTENGRPQRGIDKADVVYVEQAEGGLTRTVAVFASQKPTVEAVRSVRASDAELLSQYGKISLVASGGGGDSLTTLDASIVHGVINDRGGPDFGRDDSRPAPYNLTSDLAALSKVAKTGGARDIGFRFAASDPRVTAAPLATSVSAVVGSTPVTFGWNAKLNAYIRTLDGSRLIAADGNPIAAANVIVQFCRVTVNNGDVDVNGNPSQYTHSVGSGKAVLYRNGHKIVGKWSRTKTDGPTTFTDLNGKVLYQAPGSTYVLLSNA